MKVCDQCNKPIPEGGIIHLRFESKWYPQLKRIEAEFCCLKCLKDWLNGVEHCESRKNQDNAIK